MRVTSDNFLGEIECGFPFFFAFYTAVLELRLRIWECREREGESDAALIHIEFHGCSTHGKRWGGDFGNLFSEVLFVKYLIFVKPHGVTDTTLQYLRHQCHHAAVKCHDFIEFTESSKFRSKTITLNFKNRHQSRLNLKVCCRCTESS